MYSNSSFYGGQKGKDFKIVHIFSNVSEGLVADLNLGLTSPVDVGDYVMVSYGLLSLDSQDVDTTESYYINRNKDVNSGYQRNYNATIWQKILLNGIVDSSNNLITTAYNGFAYKFITQCNSQYEHRFKIFNKAYNFFETSAGVVTENDSELTTYYGVPNTIEAVSDYLSTIEGSLQPDEVVAVNHFIDAASLSDSLFSGYYTLFDYKDGKLKIYIDTKPLDAVSVLETTFSNTLTDLEGIENISINGNSIDKCYKSTISGDTVFYVEYTVTDDDSSISIVIAKNDEEEQSFQLIIDDDNRKLSLIQVIYNDEIQRIDDYACISYWYFINDDGEWERLQVTENVSLQNQYTNIGTTYKAYSVKYINELEKNLRGKKIYKFDLYNLLNIDKLKNEENDDSINAVVSVDHAKYFKFLDDVPNLRMLRYDINDQFTPTSEEEEKIIDLYKDLNRYCSDLDENQLNNACLISYNQLSNYNGSILYEMEKEVLNIFINRPSSASNKSFYLNIIYYQPYDDTDGSFYNRALKTGTVTINI